jgi:hypothetical protein
MLAVRPLASDPALTYLGRSLFELFDLLHQLCPLGKAFLVAGEAGGFRSL